MLIIIDCDIPFIRGVFEPYAEVRYLKGSEIDAEAIAKADALIIRTRTRCNKELLLHSQIKIIATATIGTDHIDLEYCRSRGIEVRNAKGCNARGVLQWVAAVLKHITQSDNKQPKDYTLGVVGVGSVGSLVGQYSRHWGFRVMECDPPRKEREGGEFYDITTLAKHCDILTFHTPLDASTHHLLDTNLLDIMHSKARIINASRGAVVDNCAVVNSSHEYYFDVWENEPQYSLSTLRNAKLATPHIAGYSLQGKANATAMAVNHIIQYFGLPMSDWYPPKVERTKERLIDWEELCSTIDSYCSISEESQYFKGHPNEFESLRNNYIYRQEYF